MKIIRWNKLADYIQFKPTEKQRYIIENLQRFNTIVGGKRVGKTKLAAFIALIELLKVEKNIWVVAPQYNLAKVIWQYLFDWSNKYFPDILKANTQFLQIRNAASGSVCELKSADNPISLKGKGLDLLIGDEVGDWKAGIWQEYIRPNVAEIRPGGEKGRVFLIGNADYYGSDWHKLIEMEMQDKFSYHLPTAIEEKGRLVSNNPDIITSEELKQLRASTPDIVWRQNYLANFIPGQGTVFQNIRDCATAEFHPPIASHFYTIGVDLGRLQDFTVITVVDRKTFSVVHWERFNQIEWPFQKKRILEIARKYGVYNSKLRVDQTGVGRPIVEDLEREGVNIQGLTFTNESKKDMIEKLAILLEQKKLRYPEIDQLIKELEIFGYSMSKTGRVQYGAPSGFHDDCVISLGLAAEELYGDPSLVDGPRPSNQELVHSSSQREAASLFYNQPVRIIPKKVRV